MNRATRGYFWSVVGALTGALAFAVPVGILWAAAVLPFMFDHDQLVEFATGVAIVLVGVGAVLGCQLALWKRSVADAGRTSLILGCLLGLLFLIAWWSSNTSLQSDLLPYLAGMTPMAPLLARWIATIDRELRRMKE